MSALPVTAYASAHAGNSFAMKNTMRSRPLRQGSFVLAVTIALAAAGTASPAAAREHPIVTDTAVPSQMPGVSSLSTVSPLPERPPLNQMVPPPVPEGRIGAAVNAGPVTGYGSGGMGHIPGSPPNRPYR